MELYVGLDVSLNFASIVMLCLGCEANQIPTMLETMAQPSEETFRFTTLQAEGGTRNNVRFHVLFCPLLDGLHRL